MSTLTLAIDVTAEAWRGLWYINDDAVGKAIVVEGDALARLNRLGERFAAMFEEHSTRPMVKMEGLHATAQEMRSLWVAPSEDALAPHLTAHTGTWIIRSTNATVLNLPWELIELDGHAAVGCDAGWRLFRTPLERLGPSQAIRPGPLRVLFLAAAPTDQPQLDFEREEDAISTVCGKVRDVVLRIVDSGSAEELAELVDEFRPHVVHLSGHGIVEDDGIGRFLFENERGLTDSRDVRRLANDVFRGQEVQAVFLNACQTSRAAAAGMAQHLVGAGVPLVVGWAASVADDRATQFATEFYRRLVRGEAVGRAAAHAREVIRREGCAEDALEPMQDATYALPQVYAGVADDGIIDKAARPEPYEGPRTEHCLLGGGVEGLRVGLVGRRRELQRLVPALREGEITFAALSGIGGAGKSTLATRVANRLQEDDYRVVATRVEEGPDPGTQGRDASRRLLDALATALVAEKGADAEYQATMLRNGQIPLSQRFQLAAELLNELRFLVVLDNFEEALVLESRTIADAGLAEGLRLLATNVTRGSRVVLTCRYLPVEIPTDLPNVLHVPLNEFKEHDVVKFLRREEKVEERLNQGTIEGALIGRLHAAFGGTPGFLVQARTLLALPELDIDELTDELESAQPGKLEEARQAYQERILTARLYGALPPEAQRTVSRLALSILPLPLDAVAMLTDLDEEKAQRALDAGVEYGLLQRFDAVELPTLYQPPGLLRRWLSAEERVSALDTTACHVRLAAFWQETVEDNRVSEVRTSFLMGLEACQQHGRQAQDIERWRWAAVLVATHMEALGEWRTARLVIEEIPESAHNRACWHQLAMIGIREGNYDNAREELQKCLCQSRSDGDPLGEADALRALAVIDGNEGKFGDAAERLNWVLHILQSHDNKQLEASTWHALAGIDLRNGGGRETRSKFAKALQIREAIGDLRGFASTLEELAAMDMVEGIVSGAREKLREVFAIRQRLNDRSGIASALHSLAKIDVKTGDGDEAREKFEKALEILQAIGGKFGEAETWYQLGLIDKKNGENTDARERFHRALEIQRRIGNRRGEATTLIQLASLDQEENKCRSAREKLEGALKISQATGDMASEAITREEIAAINVSEGRYKHAYKELRVALRIAKKLSDENAEAAIFFRLGDCVHRLGRIDEVAPLFAVAWQLSRKSGPPGERCDFQPLNSVCNQLGYDQAAFDGLIRRSVDSYNNDGGWSLLKDAFPEWTD